MATISRTPMTGETARRSEHHWRASSGIGIQDGRERVIITSSHEISGLILRAEPFYHLAVSVISIMGGDARSTRAVSSTVGFSLLVLLTLVGATTVVVVGGTALANIEEAGRANQASSAMTQLDSVASRVAIGQSRQQQLGLGSADGQVGVDPGAGRILVAAVDGNGSRTVLVDEALGAVTYRTGETTVAYQGGGVWRHRGDGTVMVSPPEYHYSGRTLTLPIVRVTDGPPSISAAEPLVVTRNGSVRHFPTASTANPLDDGEVYVKVTSEYHRGWRDFFESRSEGDVQHYPSNETVTVNLTVPQSVSFDHAVTATSDSPSAIQTNGNAEFNGPTRRGADMLSASREVDRQIDACQAGGCPDLTTELADDELENGTYYASGDVTVGPPTEFDTSNGDVNVVVDGDLRFTGTGPPGSEDHAVTGDGRVTFYVKGDVEIAGNAAVNTDGDADSLLMLVHSDAGEVAAASGTPQFTGLIYAPNSTLRINGGGACGATGGGGGGGGGGCDGNIVGSVVVENAEAVGNGKLSYDSAIDIEIEFDATNDLTFLHVSENRIDVREA
jgi:hypothetical protein